MENAVPEMPYFGVKIKQKPMLMKAAIHLKALKYKSFFSKNKPAPSIKYAPYIACEAATSPMTRYASRKGLDSKKITKGGSECKSFR